MIFTFCSATNGSLPACSVDASGRHWSCTSGQRKVTCSVDDGDGGIWCKDEQHCPYAEESQPIHIEVHVSSKHFLMQTYSSHFFLSDIGGRFLASGIFFLWFSLHPR